MSPRNRDLRSEHHGSRRLITRIALLAVMVAIGIVLAACGSDDSSDTSTSASSTTSGDTGVNSADAKQFRQLMGLTDTDLKNLQGKKFKLGAILPLTGPGANFAVDEGNGAKLAVDAMKNYMGMDVTYTVKDHKSGDPQAGAQAARELGIDGYGAVVNSYYAVFGSTLKAMQQYKMLSFDPGGGTGNSLKGKDFFWGFRANTPDDAFFGLKYYKQTHPEWKKVALVIWDAGAAYTDPIEAHLKEQIAANGDTYTGKILSKIGATDYASTLSKLKTMNPDIVAIALFGADPGYFMKQYATSGLKAQVMGAEFVPAAAKIAGSAYDKYDFGADYFDVNHPANELSKFFLKTYNAKFGENPGTFYQPNYYETTLAYLQLAARVAAKGGDINDGSALNDALLANPTFKSVYGGDSSTVGTIQLDPKTHDPKVRPVGLFVATDPIKQLASWNIGGGDYKVLAKS